MAFKRVNGVELFSEVTGAGEPVFFVHGAWGVHHIEVAPLPSKPEQRDPMP